MTKDEIKQRLADIRKMWGGDERAHQEEDALRADFIRHVAKGEGELAEMARLVLTSSRIKFNRWCA